MSKLAIISPETVTSESSPPRGGMAASSNKVSCKRSLHFASIDKQLPVSFPSLTEGCLLNKILFPRRLRSAETISSILNCMKCKLPARWSVDGPAPGSGWVIPCLGPGLDSALPDTGLRIDMYALAEKCTTCSLKIDGCILELRSTYWRKRCVFSFSRLYHWLSFVVGWRARWLQESLSLRHAVTDLTTHHYWSQSQQMVPCNSFTQHNPIPFP